MGEGDGTDRTETQEHDGRRGSVEARGAAGRTHVGRIREHNEDAFLVRPPLFAVADGMGGHQAGEVASAHAIEEIAGAFDAGRVVGGADLVRAFQGANEIIRADGHRNPLRQGMGTTCVAVLLEPTSAHVAHIGDSRAYLLRAGRLERLTDDHSLVAALVRDGYLRESDAERDPRRHIVTRALGADAEAMPDLRDVPLEPGDRLLLCSDGLSGVVHEQEIATLLAKGTPADAAAALVARTLDLGAPDNVTVVVVDPPEGGFAPGATVVATTVGGRVRRTPKTAIPGIKAPDGQRRRRTRALAAGLAGSVLVVAAASAAGVAVLSRPAPTPGSLVVPAPDTPSPGAATGPVASPSSEPSASSPGRPFATPSPKPSGSSPGGGSPTSTAASPGGSGGPP